MSNPFDSIPDDPAPAQPSGGGIAARAMGARTGANAPDYFEGLNAEQTDAVSTLDGPLLVLAGAGTGKTRVLTTRIAHIIKTGRAYPSQILAVTFTNKAAREMKERVGLYMGDAVEGMPWLGTFHSIGVKILRRNAELVGLKPDFTILDTDDQIRLLKQLIRAEGIDDKRWPARMLAGHIDSWKNKGLGPEQISEGDARAYGDGKGRELYRQYQARLKILNACDFGDLLTETIRLFKENPNVLAEYNNRFKYILVDEYQDTNVAQYMWLRLLAQSTSSEDASAPSTVHEQASRLDASSGSATEGGQTNRSEASGADSATEANASHPRSEDGDAIGSVSEKQTTTNLAPPNLCCVGDDDQSIYGWRGAEVDNILRFDKDFPSAKVIRLERNYRSTAHILGAAGHLIDHNEDRLGKTLFTDDVDPDASKVIVSAGWDSEEEARSIGDEIEALQSKGHILNEIAILVRASFQMREFEDRFVTMGLNYRVIGGPRFYERMEIRDAMAYFRVQMILAFERIVNKPKRGIGDATIRTIHDNARARGIPLTVAARELVETEELKPKVRGTLKNVLENFDRWRQELIFHIAHGTCRNHSG
ncbi:putative DNA helicase II [Nymphon striatum]|nr:putative DNA helicase II [Nymphon striatum]